jgi:hypothetical protein
MNRMECKIKDKVRMPIYNEYKMKIGYIIMDKLPYLDEVLDEVENL